MPIIKKQTMNLLLLDEMRACIAASAAALAAEPAISDAAPAAESAVLQKHRSNVLTSLYCRLHSGVL
jgi:hypothetical protein